MESHIRGASARHDGREARIHLRLGVRAWLSADVGGLHHHVRLVIAAAAVHRADDGEAVHQSRLLGQVLAEVHAGELGGDGLKRSAIAGRRVRLGIPHIDMTGTTRQPEQDDRLLGG